MNDNLKKWFGDSVVVDEDGNPLVVYHGTTHDFESFELEKGNVENAVGIGYYFTTSPEDASINYAGEGADLTQRIGGEVDKVNNEIEYELDIDEIVEKFEVTEEVAESLKNGDNPELADELAKREARKRLKGSHNGAVIPAYLKMEKPFDLTEDAKPFAIDWDEDYYLEQAKDEVDKEDHVDEDEESGYNEESYKEELDDKAREIYQEDYNPSEDGDGVEIWEAVQNIVPNYNDLGDFDEFEIKERITDGITPKDFYDLMKDRLMHATNEDGQLASSQIINEIVQRAGYDGFIQDAYEEFGQGRDMGQAMEGIEWGDRHYIVFDPTHIKSAIGNNGDYDPNNSDIVMKDGGKLEGWEQAKLERLKSELKEIEDSGDEKKLAIKKGQIKNLTKYISNRPQKLYKGGELENYNKWKSIDWDSFTHSKQRSNIYRLLGWADSERIDWNKLPEEDKEWFFEDFMEELGSEDTLEYIFSDKIKEIEDEYENLTEHEDVRNLEDIKKIDKEEKKLLLSDEFKDLNDKLDEYKLTLKDLQTKSSEELLEQVSEDKSTKWIIDYFLLDDNNWGDFNYVFDYNVEDLDKLYYKVLENGAVFTEEAEEQQFDMFAEVPAETPKKEEPKEEAKEVLYIDYLNKDKGHKQDRKYFDSYKAAEKWAKKEFEKFDADMIHYSTLEEKAKADELDSLMNVTAASTEKEIETPRELGTALKRIFKDKYGVTISPRYIKTVRGLDGSPYEVSTYRSGDIIPNEIRKKAVELTYGKPIEETGVKDINNISYGNSTSNRVSMTGKAWKQWLKDIENEQPDLNSEIDTEVNILSELLKMAKVSNEKELVLELDERIAFLRGLGSMTMRKGGSIGEFSKIICTFGDTNNSYSLDIDGVSPNGSITHIGYANGILYLEDTKVLNLQEIVLHDNYNDSKSEKEIIDLIKKEMIKATSKTKLIVNKSKH
jgi:hypothetical protein